MDDVARCRKRRTRSFIQANYSQTDAETGRRFVLFADGRRCYFPARQPRTVRFPIDDRDPQDQYARLFSPPVETAIARLSLPRYGLGNYIHLSPHAPPTPTEAKVIADLSRAGRRLTGFCRTGLFKRLESSGYAFLQSLERHILRNCVYLHAVEQGLPVPIGTQDAALLDVRVSDSDEEFVLEDDDNGDREAVAEAAPLRTAAEFQARAAAVYSTYAGPLQRRFKWLPANLFIEDLQNDLQDDNQALLAILQQAGDWRPDRDAKLAQLETLIRTTHPGQKILIFSQFADTVAYIASQLNSRGIDRVAGVTGDSDDPTRMAWRFSPASNGKRHQVSDQDEIDVLIATDVLSEGQNLQDAAIVVNFDLPWAIIRLIQRAGRVDRIGQQADSIVCYSFLPADGVERIIRLRARVRQRLRENAEVVGTDEAFFDDDKNDQAVRDLFTEKAGILDDAEDEVDLGSHAYQIWKNAVDRDPSLFKTIEDLPDVVFSTKPHAAAPAKPEGALVYVRTAEGNDALAWLDKYGTNVTESQLTILKAAECAPDTPALARLPNHHELVQRGVEAIAAEEKTFGGALGRPSGAKYRTYERLKRYAADVKGTLFDTASLRRAIDEIYNYPLKSGAIDLLNRQLRSGPPPTKTWPRPSSICVTKRSCASFTKKSRNRSNRGSFVSLGCGRLNNGD